MIMKRITALLLALVMCFALCACGSTPDPNLKEEDLAGTWSPSLWFLSTQLKLAEDHFSLGCHIVIFSFQSVLGFPAR